METAVWIACLGTATLAIALGTLVWRLATRISNAESKADTAASRADVAGINVAANSMKVEKVAQDLAQHREDTAKQYVSYAHMVTFESRIVDAITQLGNRIDNLFSRSGNAGHA